ncbi:hypothetical protein [Pseudomonas sp. SID14000]|uniref:hypothetical protein n=1 Tax=Pseudomonas sp. SID14000 TaxID=1986221 RepID=UPI000B3C4610|nr:hypothetical protein [Pseudomonas sp. SID14000]
MPTENRSSNTDPRDLFIRLNPLGLSEADLRKDSTGFEDQRTHGDYLLFLAGYRETHPAPQPHPEPIAWMVGTAIWWTKEEAERDSVVMGLPVVGLGPMPVVAPAEQHQGEPVACIDAEPFFGLLEALRGKIGYAIQFPVNCDAFKDGISKVWATIESLEKCISIPVSASAASRWATDSGPLQTGSTAVN